MYRRTEWPGRTGRIFHFAIFVTISVETLQFFVFCDGIINFVDKYQVPEETVTSIFVEDEPIEMLALYQNTRHKVPTSVIFNPVLVETKCFSRIYILKAD